METATDRAREILRTDGGSFELIEYQEALRATVRAGFPGPIGRRLSDWLAGAGPSFRDAMSPTQPVAERRLIRERLEVLLRQAFSERATRTFRTSA